MPYVSDAQRRFMHAKHPQIAKRWDKHTPKEADLPEHVKKAAALGLLLGLVKAAAALPGVGERIGQVLRNIGGRTEVVARGLGKHVGMDPTQGLRAGSAEARRLKLQLLGGATAAGGAYGLHKLLSRDQPPPPPRPPFQLPMYPGRPY